MKNQSKTTWAFYGHLLVLSGVLFPILSKLLPASLSAGAYTLGLVTGLGFLVGKALILPAAKERGLHKPLRVSLGCDVVSVLLYVLTLVSLTSMSLAFIVAAGALSFVSNLGSFSTFLLYLHAAAKESKDETLTLVPWLLALGIVLFVASAVMLHELVVHGMLASCVLLFAWLVSKTGYLVYGPARLQPS